MSDSPASTVQQMLAKGGDTLHPDLEPFLTEDGPFPMLRHPLVYQVPYMSAGHANLVYEHKRAEVDAAVKAGNWQTVVWMHERPYRLDALIRYVTGVRAPAPEDIPVGLFRYSVKPGEVIPAAECDPSKHPIILDVWQDCENIAELLPYWRVLFAPDLLQAAGTIMVDSPRAQDLYDSLPEHITVWRGGISGDWSWTLDQNLAARFAAHGVQKSLYTQHTNYGVRATTVAKKDVFGVLTKRGEQELLVTVNEERWPLVHPDRPHNYHNEIGRSGA